MIIVKMFSFLNKKIIRLVGVAFFAMFGFASNVFASSFYIEPSSFETTENSVVTFHVYADIDNPVNTFTAKLTYPQDLLEPLSLSGEFSEIDFWIEDKTYIENGFISLEGVSTQDKDGEVLIADISFLSKGEGVGKLSFQSGLLLSSEEGINVVEGFSDSLITVRSMIDDSSTSFTSENVGIEYKDISLEDNVNDYQETFDSLNELHNQCWYNSTLDTWQNFYPRDFYDRTMIMAIVSGVLIFISIFWIVWYYGAIRRYHKIAKDSERSNYQEKPKQY